MGVDYTMIDLRCKVSIDVGKDRYIYTEDIDKILYFVQNNLYYNQDKFTFQGDDIDSEYGDIDELDLSIIEESCINFKLVDSTDLDDEFEIITLVRNKNRISYRTKGGTNIDFRKRIEDKR